MGHSLAPDYRGRIVGLDKKDEAYVVLGTSLGSGPHDVDAHLLRVKPPPTSKAGTVPVSSLKVIAGDSPKGLRALALLASAAMKDSLVGGSVLFAEGTQFKAFQFRPLLKYMKSGTKRILIADEAGLGKTIEAAYILTEELARRRKTRVLVLCPANLIRKWKGELLGKFGLLFEATTGRGLLRLLDGGQEFRAIASFDCLKGNRAALKAARGRLDFLIVDEVHHAIGSHGAETERRNLAKELSSRSSCVVALSATPIQLEKDDLRRVLEVVLARKLDVESFNRDMALASLLNGVYRETEQGPEAGRENRLSKALDEAAELGVRASEREEIRRIAKEAYAAPAEKAGEVLSALSERLGKVNPFADVVTRTRRRDVREEHTRLPVNHNIVLSTDVTEFSLTSEAQLFHEVDAFLSSSFTHVHRLQLASSLPAMANLLRGGMRGFPVWLRSKRAMGPLEYEDGSAGDRPVRYNKQLDEDERRRCEELVGKFDRLGVDSKWDELAKVLSRLADSNRPRKAVVFTQWIPTLMELRERSKELTRVRAFYTSGEDSDRQRESTVERFKAWEGPAVLFSTDFLSEGVDLQFADTVVNYDFPYNPQRVEQRIGRIDRVGQEAETIEVHNFWVEESIDEEIREVFKRRMNWFQEALGDASIIMGTESWEEARRPRAARHNDAALVKELNQSEIFAGPEDYLDGAIHDMRLRSRGDFGRFAWLVVAQALALTTGMSAKVGLEPECAVVGPIEDLNVEAMREWARVDGNEYGAIAESLVASHRDSDMKVKIAKRPGSPGLYVPATSPLASVAAKACWNSFEQMGSQQRPLNLRSDQNPPFEGSIILCRYVCETSSTVDTVISYWNESGGTASKVEGERMISLQHWLDGAPLSVAVGEASLGSKETRKAIEEDFATWRTSAAFGAGAAPEKLVASPQDAGIRYIAVISG
ncbi:MAG: helicase-related protein [Nitrososphaerales archaeon]